MKRKALVIGSNCFTGAHIVDALLEKETYFVHGVSRSPEYKELFLPYKRHLNPSFLFHQIDVVKNPPQLFSLIEEVMPEVVINVAALSEVGLSNEQPIEYFDINTKAVVQLCNFLRRKDFLERYIHISSAEIFGSCSSPVTEDYPFYPSTPYAVSKAAADMFLNTLVKNYNFPVTIIRSTNVFGKHQQLFKIIPRACIYLKTGKKIQLHGGGTSCKSFIHIKDVTDGILLALHHNLNGTFHFTVQSEATVATIVQKVCERMGCAFEEAVEVVGERLGQDSKYLLDSTKAKTVLGWKAKRSLEEGIQETVNWIEQNWAEIEQEELNYVHKV